MWFIDCSYMVHMYIDIYIYTTYMGQTYHAIVYKPNTWQRLSDEGCKWLASLEELSFPASTCMCMTGSRYTLNNTVTRNRQFRCLDVRLDLLQMMNECLCKTYTVKSILDHGIFDVAICNYCIHKSKVYGNTLQNL